MKNYTFTIFVFIAAVTSFCFPSYFLGLNGFKFTELIIPLLQLIMFGVGATMSGNDFLEILKTPRKVIIGLICQFTIMPLLGVTIAKTFGYPNEIAAGVILVGCSPSGLASNVMCLIAKANVPLSITITSIATLLSPLLTPLLMSILANEYIQIDTSKMVFDIIKMVIVPVVLGVTMNFYLKKITLFLNSFLPLLSMIGITLIIVIITAAGQASLKTVGLSLIFGVLLHNIGGYILGYYFAKILKLNPQDCRTVAIEVGLQNSGLASGIALQMAKITTVGLAPALFGPIMNLTGSVLAGFWSKKQH